MLIVHQGSRVDLTPFVHYENAPANVKPSCRSLLRSTEAFGYVNYYIFS